MKNRIYGEMNNQMTKRDITTIFDETEKAVQILYNDMFVWVPKSKIIFGKDSWGYDCFQVSDSVVESCIASSDARGFQRKYIGG